MTEDGILVEVAKDLPVSAELAPLVVVGSGHQVVYSVTTSLIVTVAVDSKAFDSTSEHLFSSHDVIVTIKVEFL